MKHNFLSRTVIIFGLVSFFNDTASEMITPLLPLFLTATLGAGPAVIGLVEGVAEASASLLKLFSGYLADRGWNSKKLVLGGYGLSNIARPIIGFAFSWSWVLVLRFLDRVGKGIRTTPRDAMIASSIETHLRGRAFGFHRAFDHAGAVVGPLIAFMLLEWGMELHSVFIISVIPGIIVVVLIIFGLPNKPVITDKISYEKLSWHAIDIRLRALIIATSGISLATMPEVFLVLWAQSRGLEVVWIPLLWAAASAIKVVVAIPGGYAADHFGRLPVLILGWCIRIVILIVLTLLCTSDLTIWLLFLAYAASLAMTEGAELALIGDYSPQGKKATMFGIYHMISGLLLLPSAVLFGSLWQWFGEASAFFTSAGLISLSLILLLIITSFQEKHKA